VPNLFVRTENEIFEETNYLFLAGSILQIETKHFALGHKLRTIATFLSFSKRYGSGCKPEPADNRIIYYSERGETKKSLCISMKVCVPI